MNSQRPATKCPKCGNPLTLLSTDTVWIFYRCQTHGEVVMLAPTAGARSEDEQPTALTSRKLDG